MSFHNTTETQCFTNNEWQNYLAFLVNITDHLNNWNWSCREATNCSKMCAAMLLLSK